MPMETNSHKEILYQKFDAFSMEENPDISKGLLKEMDEILNNIKHYDAEDYHIWGLIYYSEENLDAALGKFKKAFELDPGNFLACLYVAHCFHDKNDLINALAYYEKVDQEQLKEFQIWRYIKLIEQIGYCHFKLGNETFGRKKFEEVLTWYKKPDLGPLAVPTEIMECLNDFDPIVREIKEIEGYL